MDEHNYFYRFHIDYIIKRGTLYKHHTYVDSAWKRLISYEQKELLRWNKKHFSSFLKAFYWRPFIKFFLDGDSPTSTYFSPVLHFKWLISIWNATLGWNRLSYELSKDVYCGCQISNQILIMTPSQRKGLIYKYPKLLKILRNSLQLMDTSQDSLESLPSSPTFTCRNNK